MIHPDWFSDTPDFNLPLHELEAERLSQLLRRQDFITGSEEHLMFLEEESAYPVCSDSINDLIGVWDTSRPRASGADRTFVNSVIDRAKWTQIKWRARQVG